MQREIGSEFWEVPTQDSFSGAFEANLFFRSGRDALRFIIRDIQENNSINSVALPSWCCDSIILPFEEAGIDIEFYTYDSQAELANVTADAALLMDFFGFRGLEMPEKYRGITIRDLTHTSFLRNYSDADYSFGSLRKWVGVYTGGYASKKEKWSIEDNLYMHKEYSRIRKAAMEEKDKYISGTIANKDFLNAFALAENMLEDGNIYGADPEDITRMRKLDIEHIVAHRRANASRVIERLSDISLFKEIDEQDCPLFVPIVVERNDRDFLRKHLISKAIYCPVHWPLTEHHSVSSDQERIYNTELSIVCDQRYSLEDMDRICDEIENYFSQRS